MVGGGALYVEGVCGEVALGEVIVCPLSAKMHLFPSKFGGA